jgi:hypothetical protein
MGFLGRRRAAKFLEELAQYGEQADLMAPVSSLGDGAGTGAASGNQAAPGGPGGALAPAWAQLGLDLTDLSDDIDDEGPLLAEVPTRHRLGHEASFVARSTQISSQFARFASWLPLLERWRICSLCPPRVQLPSPENRGVTSSSLGLAIHERPAKLRFSQVASPGARSAQTLPWAFSGLFSGPRTGKCGRRDADTQLAAVALPSAAEMPPRT